ncbi:MAG: hypothetical protein IKO40_12690 [Kiritimatiellae bacterium]|nr:hypothetical protein [Kiritimatiellia bacterium]
MKKTLVTFLILTFTACSFAAVTITTSAKTFQKTGGAASVVIQGDGSWTATSDSDWIVIKQGTSGSGAGSCVYVVNANATADVRIGHIDIGGNTYTITQYGYDATISPTSATFDRYGGSGSISVTADAGVSWSAVANNDWITVSPSSGTSVGTVNYSVAEYLGVVSRVGSITIGGKTFSITQMGVDVSISPESTTKGSDADIIAVTINALATTQWTVTPNAPWISIIDKETGYGDYVLTLAINANPSFERRTGTVSIGTATLTISQAGTTTAALSIDPANATAAASGAYGNVAVYATPDADWTAESLAPWLTISEGATGAGNGNIKYVASANPTLSSRTGQIVVTPPHKVVEPDLYRGLTFWIKERYNVEGNEQRYSDYSLSKAFDGSFSMTLQGSALPKQSDNCFTLSFSFKLTELDRINRLFRLASNHNFYFNEDNEFCYCYTGNDSVVYPNIKVDATNAWHTIVFAYTENGCTIYFGRQGEQLARKYDTNYTVPLALASGSVAMSNFVFGYCASPTAGYLTGGQVGNIRFWNRALTDAECQLVDANQSDAMSADDIPLGAPTGIKWDYFPMDANGCCTKSTSMTATVRASMTNWVDAVDRYGAERSAVVSTGKGQLFISKMRNFFATSETNATYSFWMMVSALPSGSVPICSRLLYKQGIPQNGHEATPGYFKLLLTKEGSFEYSGGMYNGAATFGTTVKTGDWHMITIVGKSAGGLQFFVDGNEIGNTLAGTASTLGYYYYDDYYPVFSLGGWNGAVDGLTFYHEALTPAQVRELYEKQRPQKVIHTVTQGVQSAQLNKSEVTAPAEGSVESVALTLAQSVQWTAQSNSSWIQITGDAEGAGSANVSFTIGANPAVTSRTGSVTVAGKTVTVVQEGLRASVECADTSFGVESDSGTIWVETEGGGTWTASADVDWIHLFDESGTGTTPVMFVVDDYTTTTASRSGTVTIAGHKVVITQQGYELSIDPAVAEVGSNAGAGQFGVSAPIDAVWEAIADCDWITIIGARTGIGDGVIQYTIADNTTGETRTGRIVIAGKTYTITQKTTLPVTTKAVGSGTIVGAGTYNQGASVTLTATPAAGYVFSHWSGDAVGVTNQVTISVDSPKDVTATFIPESAAEQLAAEKAAQGGFYTRDQIYAMELGNVLFDVDPATGRARIGVKLMETSDLAHPDWKPVSVTTKDLDIGADGSVGIHAPATGKAKFFKVISGE